MASVQPRTKSNGEVSWRVQFRIGSQMRSRSFADQRGAQQFSKLVDRVGGAVAVKTWEARMSASADVPALRDWIGTYLDPASGMLTGIEPGTRAGYRGIADRSLIPILGDLPVDAITKADVGRWVAWQEAQPSARKHKGQAAPIAPKTVRNYHALLSSVLQAAVEHKLRPDNPAFKTRLTRGRSREGVFLSSNEFAVLLHFIPAYYKPLIQFLVGTGMRWGEATALTWGDIELDGRTATARIEKAWKKGPDGKPLLGTPKSSKSRRTVSLTPELVDMLGDPKPGDQLVFPGPVANKNIWYGSFSARIWKPAVAAANDAELCVAAGLTPIGKTPNIHDLRHTHASWLIADGAPLTYVQERLGHENITTTIHTYTHLMPNAHAEMAAIISRRMSNVLPQLEA